MTLVCLILSLRQSICCRDKYSNLTSEQLKLLSNKILYRFQIQCEEQAKQWLTKIDEINKVAADKGWDVTRADL